MARALWFLAAAIAAGASPAAHAFRISTHEALTMRAAELEGESFPELREYGEVMASGNSWEDKNVFLKWVRYSHYFKPGAALKMWWRTTSDVRVRSLWNAAIAEARRGRMRQAYDRIGRIAHHIQDMASPGHVVPVTHGLSDGFESFTSAAMVASAAGARPLGELSGAAAQVALAAETLGLVREGSFRAAGRVFAWRDFWRERGDEFGAYGPLGNRFGAPFLELAGQRVILPRAPFDAFARGRLEAALSYTRAFLRFAVRELRALAVDPGYVVRR